MGSLFQWAVGCRAGRRHFVIPAKAGIQKLNELGPGFRRGDDSFSAILMKMDGEMITIRPSPELQTAYAVGSFAGLRGSMLPLMPPLKLFTSKPFWASTRAAK